ncbi:hypothetical protein AW15_20330 [Aeromonas sp. HZM]|nr:hypothetical protein AW15_20330 [Aeromonas sp. HZM]
MTGLRNSILFGLNDELLGIEQFGVITILEYFVIYQGDYFVSETVIRHIQGHIGTGQVTENLMKNKVSIYL